MNGPTGLLLSNHARDTALGVLLAADSCCCALLLDPCGRGLRRVRVPVLMPTPWQSWVLGCLACSRELLLRPAVCIKPQGLP